MLKTALIACTLLAATPAPAAQSPSSRPSPAEIEKAERAFAADGLALGVRDSFLKHMADDAIVFRPGPVNAKALYEKRPSSKTPRLEWWPQKVVIARSGDLGLSVGPWAIDGKRGGYYATIWRKGADGQWKWVYDGGADADASKAPPPEVPAGVGPIATHDEGSPAKALEAVRAIEARLATKAIHDAPAAYRNVLAKDAWMLGPNDTYGMVPADIIARLGVRPHRIAMVMTGGGASSAGDFVWTYGEAGWVGHSDTPIDTHYMRVWQRRPDGWRLIFETLINDP
jgi:ketosteroid isomerase-like protein